MLALLAVAALILLLLVGGASRSTAAEKPPVPDPGTGTSTLTRAQLQARLAELARAAPPRELRMGAMCYDMMGPPERVDHICPHCGARTLYVRPPYSEKPDAAQQEARRRFDLVQRMVPLCRNLQRTVPVLPVELDERELCATCTPAAAKPDLVLVLHPPGVAEPRRVRGVTADDLRLLAAFLAGKDRWKGDQDQEFAVKEGLARLAELLGLDKP